MKKQIVKVEAGVSALRRASGAAGCGASSSEPSENGRAARRSSPVMLRGKIEHLIPIAMVIAGGCEPCSERMVRRALAEGSTWEEVDRTLRIVAHMQQLDCFAEAVGADVVARMEMPLAAGQRTLEEARVLPKCCIDSEQGGEQDG